MSSSRSKVPKKDTLPDKKRKKILCKPMKYQCDKCRKFLSSAWYLKKHTERECLCKILHKHHIVDKSFDSSVDAENFIIEEKLDVALSVYKTAAKKLANNEKCQYKTLKYYVCRIGKRDIIGCPAVLKIIKSKDKFLVLGCLTHNHDISAKDLKLSKQAQHIIRGLLKHGISPKAIKDVYFSDENAEGRPVTMRDIYRIRRTMPNLNHVNIDSCDKSVPPFSELLTESLRYNMPKGKTTSMINKLKYAVRNPSEGNKLLEELSPIFNKYTFPNAKRKKLNESGNSSTVEEIVNDKVDLINLLKEGVNKPFTDKVWQKIVCGEVQDVINEISKYNNSDRTLLIENFLSARILTECFHCEFFILDHIKNGFVVCDCCGMQCHIMCADVCTNKEYHK